jgi:hypothetical protein
MELVEIGRVEESKNPRRRYNNKTTVGQRIRASPRPWLKLVAKF